MEKSEEKPTETPAPAEAPKPDAAAQTKSAAPVMDVVAPPPAVKTEGEVARASEPAPEDTEHKEVVPPKLKKQPGSGVGLAIVATVIIVLGLAVLATFAFLQSK